MRSLPSFATLLLLALPLGQASAQTSADSYAMPAGTPAHIRNAIESSMRSDADRARDAGRKPAQILALSEIEPGDRVVELGAFGHYYSTLLTQAVGPQGYVYMVDMPWIERFGGEAGRAFDASHANASYTLANYNEMDLPADVDAVTMVLFYHDLTTDDVDTADMNRRIFDALKPGGTYLVVDHAAEAGSGWRDASTLHRIDPAAIRSEVLAAGFELVTDSDLLANAGDDHSLNMRDPAIRGGTDRAVLLFRKPSN